MNLETYKTPGGESLRTFDISHKVRSNRTTDARDQSMRLASTSVDPKEVDLLRESVQFALGSAALTPAAQGTLDASMLEQIQALSEQASAGLAPGAMRVEVETGRLDPRLRLTPCERIEAHLPSGARACPRLAIPRLQLFPGRPR